MFAQAQPTRYAYNWYFGELAGLTFQNGNAEVLTDGQLQTNEGSSSISDPVTGALLFYTDGVTVWNRLHEVMPNGTGLNGDPSTSQSALIVPVPGSTTQYYIFNPAPVTTLALRGRCYCLYYSIVDMRRADGYGDVTTKNQHLIDDVTEHIAAVADCKNEGWWVVLRSRLTRHFYSFHVELGRIDPVPVISDAGNPLLTVQDAGNMHISPNGRKLVITSTSGNSQLYDFDVSTGKVLNPVSLFAQISQGHHYGSAFSREGDRVYVAVSTTDGQAPTKIYQFDASANSANAIQSSRTVIGLLPNNNDWTPMQLGPDGRIYVGRPKQPYLAVISDANRRGDSVRFQDSAIYLNNSCRSGLPTFPANFLGAGSIAGSFCDAPIAAFATDSGCIGSCLLFTEQSVGRVDSYEWFFEGATTSTSIRRDPGPICYTAAGVFAVRLITKNPYGIDTANATVQIFPRPYVEVDSVLEICPGESVQLNARGATSYRWEPARTLSDPTSASPIASPEATTRYTVIGTGTNTCKDTASVFVRVRMITGGPDKTMCRGSEVQLEASGADTYAWSPTTGLNDPSSARPIARPAQTTTYTVRLRGGSCDFVDTVIVNVVDTFSVTVTGARTACAGTSVPVSVSGGAVHTWWPKEGVANPTSGTTTITPLQTTTYYVEARSGNCVDTGSITITVFPAIKVNAGPDASSCEGSAVVLTANVSGDGSLEGTRVTWSPSAGLNTDTGFTVVAQPVKTTPYIVTATTVDGCIAYDTVVVQVKGAPALSAGSDVGICIGKSVQLFVSGDADEYSWSPTQGLNDPTSPAPVASPTVTTDYVVTGRIGGCTSSDTVRVSVSSLNLTLSRDTSICQGSAALLRASGASRYEWSPSEGLSDPTIATPIASPTVTTTYLVRGIDALGCEDVKTVRVSLLDALPLTLIAGNATAQAGTENVGIPIYVEVDEALLPVHIDTLRAEMLIDMSVFVTRSADRGTASPTLRRPDQVTRILLTDFYIVSPRQKLTEIRGLVLASSVQVAPIRWGEITWQRTPCPVTKVTNGRLFVTGCNLSSRVLRLFSTASVMVQPLPGIDQLAVDVGGDEPGTYTIRVTSLDGRVIIETPVVKGANEIDMSSVGSGLYLVSFSTQHRTETVPMAWVR